MKCFSCELQPNTDQMNGMSMKIFNIPLQHPCQYAVITLDQYFHKTNAVFPAHISVFI